MSDSKGTPGRSQEEQDGSDVQVLRRPGRTQAHDNGLCVGGQCPGWQRPPSAPVRHHVGRIAGLGGLVEAAKRWKLLEALLYAPSKSVDIGQHEVARSERERAAGWLNKLEQLIDTRVPVRWRDGVTP